MKPKLYRVSLPTGYGSSSEGYLFSTRKVSDGEFQDWGKAAFNDLMRAERKRFHGMAISEDSLSMHIRVGDLVSLIEKKSQGALTAFGLHPPTFHAILRP